MKQPSSTSRIVAFDLLRGFFLFVIIVNHLGRFPSLYDFLTWRSALWVSAAEGFFFVSGLMLGLVRGRKLIDKSMALVSRLVLKRALILYLWSVGLSILFTFLTYQFIDNPGIKLGVMWKGEGWGQVIEQSLRLDYVYGWADFLTYYCQYLLLAPVAIWLLRKGLWPVLLLVSAAVWSFSGSQLVYNWQLLFFSGTIVGFYWPQIQAWQSQLKQNSRQLIVYTIWTVAVCSLILSIIVTSSGYLFGLFNLDVPEWLQSFRDFFLPESRAYFNRRDLFAPRLGLFYVWMLAGYLFVDRFKDLILRYTKDFFVVLGQNSLYVYILHAFIVYFIDLALSKGQPLVLNFLLVSVVLGLIYLAVKKRFLFRIIPR